MFVKLVHVKTMENAQSIRRDPRASPALALMDIMEPRVKRVKRNFDLPIFKASFYNHLLFKTKKKDVCQENPCQNGGRCLADPSQTTGFTCQCVDWFIGSLCERSNNTYKKNISFHKLIHSS